MNPRVARTRRTVLDATADLLEEGGLAAATIDAIRDRSGVSKTTIYKHWPNRLCVAVDAFAERLAREAALPDTGSVRADLTDQIARVSTFYSSPVGSVFLQLVAQAAQDPDAAALLKERLRASRRDGIQHLWSRAVARGEIWVDLDPDLAMDLVFGPVMWRLLRGGERLTGAEVDQMTDVTLNGLLGVVSGAPREQDS